MPEETPVGTGNQKDIEENKVLAIISYFWLLCLIPLLAKKDSPFAQFHAKQGLALAIVQTIWAVASWVLVFIPVLGVLINSLGWIAIFVLWIIGIINASSGKMQKLPVIGGLTENIKI